jgi:hypothetical protein
MRRRLLLLGLSVALVARTASGFVLVVTDAPVTLRNAITATVKDYLVNLQQEQRQKLERMARRLSAFARLDRFAVPGPPRWRTRRPDEFLYDGEYNAALIFGDAAGAALFEFHPASPHRGTGPERASVGRPGGDPGTGGHIERGGCRRHRGDERHRPASPEWSQVRAAGHQRTGGNGHRSVGPAECNGGPRQNQRRRADRGMPASGAHELLAGVVEQLLVDSKRARDSEAAALNMQLTTLRSSRAADEAFVAGTGEALRTWRQP